MNSRRFVLTLVAAFGLSFLLPVTVLAGEGEETAVDESEERFRLMESEIPQGWKLIEDKTIRLNAPEDLKAFKEMFQIEVVEVDNLFFDVDGTEIQVNLVWTTSEADAKLACEMILAINGYRADAYHVKTVALEFLGPDKYAAELVAVLEGKGYVVTQCK